MAKHKNSTTRRNETPPSSPLPITVVMPKDRFALLRVVFETITVTALLVSLGISFIQLKSANRKEVDAAHALTLAKEALSVSQTAQDLIKVQQASLVELRELEETTSRRARIGYLTVKAENGDRNAFNELLSLTKRTAYDIFDAKTPEDKNIQRILSLYQGKHINDPVVAMATNTLSVYFGADNVAGLLGGKSQESRSGGINAIHRLRVNAQIPRLIEMIATEPDLHVLQLLGVVLADMLRPVGYNEDLDIYALAVLTDSTTDHLNEYWKNNSNALLSVKPRYWKEVENPPYANKWVLTDPSAEPDK